MTTKLSPAVETWLGKFRYLHLSTNLYGSLWFRTKDAGEPRRLQRPLQCWFLMILRLKEVVHMFPFFWFMPSPLRYGPKRGGHRFVLQRNKNISLWCCFPQKFTRLKYSPEHRLVVLLLIHKPMYCASIWATPLGGVHPCGLEMEWNGKSWLWNMLQYLAPWAAEYSLSTMTLARPKSATLVIKFSPRRTFLAARSQGLVTNSILFCWLFKI